jgi:hypothetical protein
VVEIFYAELENNQHIVNHYVVSVVLRSLAVLGNEEEIETFWNNYHNKLDSNTTKVIRNYCAMPHNEQYPGCHFLLDLMDIPFQK